jgi:hypothetical protein
MRAKSIPVIIALSALLFLPLGLYTAEGQSDQPTTSEKTPSAFVPVSSWEFNQVVDGKKVVHDFVIQNKGNAPLNISKVKTA